MRKFLLLPFLLLLVACGSSGADDAVTDSADEAAAGSTSPPAVAEAVIRLRLPNRHKRRVKCVTGIGPKGLKIRWLRSLSMVIFNDRVAQGLPPCLGVW